MKGDSDSIADKGAEKTCPRCGSVLLRAEQCRHCGYRTQWVLKSRARALAAVNSGRHRRSLASMWAAWIALSLTVILVVVALGRKQWFEWTLSRPEVAAVEAEIGARYPTLQGLGSDDPETHSQIREAIAQSLDSGKSREEALARALAVLSQLSRNEATVVSAQAAAGANVGPARKQSSASLPRRVESDSIALGPAGEMIGVSRLRTRRCSGTGDKAECIPLFEDLDTAVPGTEGAPMDAASARKRIEAFRQKANQYHRALEEL